MDPEFISPLIKNLPLILSFFGVLLGCSAIFLYDYVSKRFELSSDNSKFLLWNSVSSFFYHAGYFNTFYNNFFLDFLEVSYFTTNKYIDKGILELFGPFGFYKLFRILSLNAKSFMPTIVFFTVG